MTTALAADPVMQQAEMQHMASRENTHPGHPRHAAAQRRGQQELVRVGNQRQSNARVREFDLQVNLFSWNNWIALKQASSTVAAGEANYQAAREDLIQPGDARADFAVLGAADALAAQQQRSGVCHAAARAGRAGFEVA